MTGRFVLPAVICVMLSCGQKETVAPKRNNVGVVSSIQSNGNTVDLSAIFSKRGKIIPHELYKTLGIKQQMGELYSDSFFDLPGNNKVCVYSGLPSGCSDFYCYTTYYVALVKNNACTSLKTVSVTLGSQPNVELLENNYLSISNEIEQYSSHNENQGASLTDKVLDFKKIFEVSESKLIEVQS